MSISKAHLSGRRLFGALLVSVVAAAFMVADAGPAQAACGDNPYTRYYNEENISGWYMGTQAQKLGEGCYDGNVRYSSQSASHRGRWKSNAGNWFWSDVGPVWINAGTQSPVKVLIEGPITVHRLLRIGSTWYESWGIWWF